MYLNYRNHSIMLAFQTTFLIALLATASASILTSLQGSVSYPLTEKCEDIFIRLNGNILVCSYYWEKKV